MRYGVLGGLRFIDLDGKVHPFGSAKQRSVLGLLICHAPDPVSIERLIDALWGGEPPRSARANIQVQIHRLRALLGESEIAHTPGGYRLTVDAGELDADRFEQLADAGREALGRADHQEAAGMLASALALWRGEPYAGLEEIEDLQVEANRLSELRLAAHEDRIEADLALGRHSAVVAELPGMIGQHPFRERPRRLLMLALYRSGRVQEALDVYRDVRETWVAELGLEPGPELRELEQAILTEDASLDPPTLTPIELPALTTPSGPGPSGPVSPAELPALTVQFTGRHDELQRVLAWLTAPRKASDVSHLEPPRLIAISGPGGVGKSSLAIQAAHTAGEAYPDGRLYVNIHATTPGSKPLTTRAALGRLFRSLGVGDDQIPEDTEEASARFRTLTTGRRLLIVLDDPVDPAQVRALLPGSGALLVTSRPVLAALDGAEHLRLSALSEDESVVMLARAVGLVESGRVAAEPEVAARITRLCGLLPLAVRIAGARLASRPDWTLASYAERLSDARHRLDELEHADLDVRSSIAVSHQHLDPDTAEVFDRLGLLDLPDFTPPVVGALIGRPVGWAARQLDRLVEAQLLIPSEPDRYRPHDLVRLYARERAEARFDRAEQAACVGRVLDHFLATARAVLRMQSEISDVRLAIGPADTDLRAAPISFADQELAVGWIRHELDNLLAVVQQAASRPDADPARIGALAAAVGVPFAAQGCYAESVALNRCVLDLLERDGVPPLRTMVHRDLANGYTRLFRVDEASRHYGLELADCVGRGDRRGEAVAYNGLGLMQLQLLEDPAAAVGTFEQALAIHGELGNQRGAAAALNNLAAAYEALGRFDEAEVTYHRCLRIHAELPDSDSLGLTLGNLGEHYVRVGRPERAIEPFEAAVQLLAATGRSVVLAGRLWDLADCLSAVGRRTEAATRRKDAVQVARAIRILSEDDAEALIAQPDPVRPAELSHV